MDLINKIDNLALKRLAIEALLSRLSSETDRELIADRILILLNGDLDKLDMLVSGIPHDFCNVNDRLKAEEIFKNRHANVKEVASIELTSFDTLKFNCVVFSSRYIKPGDKESRKIIESGGYCANSKYFSDNEFTEKVDYEESTTFEEPVSSYEQAGIKFKKF